MTCCRRKTWMLTFFERRLSALCSRYSWFVSQHPYPFIVLPLLVSVVLNVGWLYRKIENDTFYLCTPLGSRGWNERQIFVESFPLVDGHYVPGRSVTPNRECYVIVMATGDNGNILDEQTSEAIKQLNRFITEDIAVDDNNTHYTYRELCLRSGFSCYNNSHIYNIPYLAQHPDPYANISFPVVTYDKNRYYIGASMYGAKLDRQSRQLISAKAWLLTYQLRFADPNDNRLSSAWETQFVDQLLAYQDDLISLSVFNSQTLDEELARNSQLLMPRFAVMFTLLIVFSCACTLVLFRLPKTRRLAFDWVLSRPCLALLGVFSAALGVVSSIGLLSFLGVPYIHIVAVMPFLIIAVRLDNTFLMIGALDNTRRTWSVEHRISEAMSEAAVSITLTVLTDICSFAVGVLTDFPIVQIFCIHTTAAIIVTFAYQLTFLLGMLVLYARAEADNRHSLTPWVKTEEPEQAETSAVVRWTRTGSRAVSRNTCGKCETSKCNCATQLEQTVDGTAMGRWFRDVYAPLLMRRRTKIGVVVLLIVYLAVSVYGCLRVKTGLEPIKVLVDDSYAIPYYHYKNLFDEYGPQLQVAVFNPGNLTDPVQRQRMIDIRNRFAHAANSIGEDGVEFWMDTFDMFLQRTAQMRLADLTSDDFYKKLDFFLSLNDNMRFRLDVNWHNDSGQPIIAAFRFLIGVKNFNTSLQIEAVKDFRAIADSFSEFNVTCFHIYFLWIDQYLEIIPNIAQEIYSGMLFMIAIAIILIPHPLCSIWVTAAIASIDTGVIGFMTMWGLNMDAISMITITMSIGFSVDFTAHIAYAYVVNHNQTSVDRIRHALGALGWPVFQGAIATLLGVIALADLQSYLVVSFFKTVFLVIIFGLLHALVFLPVLLSVLTPKGCCQADDDDDSNRHSSATGSTIDQTPKTANGNSAKCCAKKSDKVADTTKSSAPKKQGFFAATLGLDGLKSLAGVKNCDHPSSLNT